MKHPQLLLIAFFLFTHLAYAFCYEPKIRVDDEFFISDSVFIGQIAAVKKIGLTPEGYYDSYEISWTVLQVFRGSHRPSEVIKTVSGNDSGGFLDADIPLGSSYVVFAQISNVTSELVVDGCGNSALFKDSFSTISKIKAIRTQPTGLLYGELINCDVNFARFKVNCSGIEVVARSKSGTYSTTTNPDGTFLFPVPSGVYSVTMMNKGIKCTAYDLSYKNPTRVAVPGGGSAGLAFEQSSP